MTELKFKKRMDFSTGKENKPLNAFILPLCDDSEFENDFAEIMTPPKFKVMTVDPPAVVDEDSGLGMEYDTPSLPANKIGKRTLDVDGDDDGSIIKKRLKRSVRKQKPFRKALSFHDKPMSSEQNVPEIVEKFVTDDTLTGNGIHSHCLPTIPGKHCDLKSITPETMVNLLTGRYDDVIHRYRIIDCRYPYEYEGGHIKGAENMYTPEHLEKLLEGALMDTPQSDTGRDILIFHCEFSSERAPRMCRLLRQRDREANQDRYPVLNYPEVYILHNGYKAFFEHTKEFSTPVSYRPMLASSHSQDLRHFRSKSKSWSDGRKRRNRSHRLMF